MYVKKSSLAGMVRRGALSPVLFLGLVLAPALTQAEGLYAGANYGNTKLKKETFCNGLDAVYDPGFSCSVDNKDEGWRLYGGNHLMKNFAVEFGYLSLGKYGTKSKGTITGTPVTGTAEFKAKGFNLAFLGILPVTKEFSFVGRIGIFRWNVKTSGIVSGGGATVTASAKDTYPGFTPNNIGVGVMYDFSKTMSVRVEWERFVDIGNTDITDSANVDLLSVGLVYKFK